MIILGDRDILGYEWDYRKISINMKQWNHGVVWNINCRLPHLDGIDIPKISKNDINKIHVIQ